MSFSMPPGMTLQQMLRIMGKPSAPVAEEKPAEPVSRRRRAHTAQGHFKADDPVTPQNEAWQAEN